MQRPFAPVMSVTAMQIAVACGWICLLNVLTILALKVLNRELHAITHVMVSAATQASLVSDYDALESAQGAPTVLAILVLASSRLCAMPDYRHQQQFVTVWQLAAECQHLLDVLLSAFHLFVAAPALIPISLYV